MIKKTSIILASIFCIITMALPTAHATSYSISIRDTTITPYDLDIGDTLNIKVQYRIEGPSDPNVKLYLYIDDILEKTYTKSHIYAGTYYYTFYFDSDNLEGRRHEIKIKAKVYDGNTLKDTDTYTQNIYFDDNKGISTYNLNIDDITITPINAHADDTISIRTKFTTETPQRSKVKLYLYIDQELKTTYTANYYSATRYYTFSYSTKDLEKGIHTAKIKAELYRDSWLKDTDSQTENFILLEKRNINHDLDITSINYNSPISTKERIPVTITVKNSGNIDEENVKIKMILDAKTAYSTPFYLIRGQSKAITTYIDTPEKSGKYEIVIIAYNQNSEQKSIQFIETYGYTLSLAISPKEEAYVGDWIKISGYAKQDGTGTTRKIDIYKDDIYEKTIMPAENGVYTDYVRFDTAQYHKITADLAGVRKDKIILIKQKETATTGTTATAGDDTISMEVEKDKPYTIIIVKEGTERIYIEKEDTQIPGKDTEDLENADQLKELDNILENISSRLNATDRKIDSIDKEMKTINVTIKESIEENTRNTNTQFEEIKDHIKKAMENLNSKIDKISETEKTKEDQKDSYRYVDIETSNKELIVNNFGSNILSITISNHLGSKNTFSMSTDFSEDWVFLPKSESIENGQSKTLYIYFNPLNARGEYSGHITIYNGNETIKEIPLTLYVAEEYKEGKEQKTSKDFIGPDTFSGTIYLLALFLIVVIFLYFRKSQYEKEDKRPLEPKIIPGFIGHPRKANEYDNTVIQTKRKENQTLSSLTTHRRNNIPPFTNKAKQTYHVSWDHVIM